jgi:threonine dehydrogenase-like Zn-dependent dehydrogenase
VGLLVIAAIRGLGYENPILASARWDHQGEWAMRLGATERLPTGSALYEEVARRTEGKVLQTDLGPPVMTGGVGIVYDCVASSRSINQVLRLAAAGGRVVLVGMPGLPWGVDWTGIWYRETRVRGSYAYGTETIRGRPRRTFEVAMEIMEAKRDILSGMVTNRFSIDAYRDALTLAMTAGRRGALKVAFEHP